MRVAIIVGIIAATCLAAVFFSHLQGLYFVWDRGEGPSVPRLLKGVEVNTADFPGIVEAMSLSSAEVCYAAFAFGTPDRPSDDDALNVQISVEHGKVGFDWILLAPRNIEDKEKFTTFARAKGFEPINRTMNGVSYLRVESANAAELATSVITEMYHHPPGEPLALFHEGFDWPRT